MYQRLCVTRDVSRYLIKLDALRDQQVASLGDLDGLDFSEKCADHLCRLDDLLRPQCWHHGSVSAPWIITRKIAHEVKTLGSKLQSLCKSGNIRMRGVAGCTGPWIALIHVQVVCWQQLLGAAPLDSGS